MVFVSPFLVCLWVSSCLIAYQQCWRSGRIEVTNVKQMKSEALEHARGTEGCNPEELAWARKASTESLDADKTCPGRTGCFERKRHRALMLWSRGDAEHRRPHKAKKCSQARYTSMAHVQISLYSSSPRERLGKEIELNRLLLIITLNAKPWCVAELRLRNCESA